jgi:hypothetical protein
MPSWLSRRVRLKSMLHSKPSVARAVRPSGKLPRRPPDPQDAGATRDTDRAEWAERAASIGFDPSRWSKRPWPVPTEAKRCGLRW